MNTNSKNMITIKFSADTRLPYEFHAPWIASDAYYRSVYGTLTHVTSDGLFTTQSDDALLEFVKVIDQKATQFLFKLKPGQYFEYEGTQKIEATAHDLVFSYSIPFYADVQEIFDKIELKKIIGTEKIVKNSPYNENSIKGLEIIDNYTVKISIKSPDPNFIMNLSSYRYPIISQYFYQKGISNPKLPGLGKYKVIEENKNESYLILERKQKQKNTPDFIKIVSQPNAYADILWKDMWGQLGDSYEKKILKIPYGTLFLLFGGNSILGNNDSFRKAVHQAINSDDLVDNIPYMIKNYEVLPSHYWGRIGACSKYNLENAKKLISHLGPFNKNIDILVYGQNAHELKKPYFVKLKKQLEEIDLKINYVLDNGTLDPQSATMVITGIATPFKDPNVFLGYFTGDCVHAHAIPRKFSFIKNKIQNISLDDSETQIKKIVSDFYENDLVIPLWDLLTVYNVNNETIADLGPQPGGMKFDIWKVQTTDK